MIILESFGGIVGYIEEEGCKVSECYNKTSGLKDVSSSFGYCGGIVGGSKGGVIEDCYNMSKVEGAKEYVGGICGCQWRSGAIRNVYNNGEIITQQDNVGGISGYVGTCRGNNYINIGTIVNRNSSGKYVGDVCGQWVNGSAVWEQGTWLDSTQVSKDDMESWTDEQIKGYLGNHFTKDTQGINEGLPILTWQAE